MIYKIALLKDRKEIKKIYEFLQRFPLDYPNYFEWLKQAIRELQLGYKHCFYAINCEGQIVGTMVFQPHKKDKHVLELKNLRVDPQYQGRGIGSSLESLTTHYARSCGFKMIQGDAHQGNPVIPFMQKRGYIIEAVEHLYCKELMEVILCKKIENGTHSNSFKKRKIS